MQTWMTKHHHMLIHGAVVVIVLIGMLLVPAVGQSPAGDEQPQLVPLAQILTRGLCQGTGAVRFTAAPANPDDLSHIFPLGLMTGSHVTPVDHQYYYWETAEAALERYTVHAPADGVVVQVDYMRDDYRLIIEHSCDVYSIWIHLETLAGPLAHLQGTLASSQHSFDRIPVSAGELIAYDGGTNGFDFSVHDARVVLPGFVQPESYVAEPWKIHTVDPFDYFAEPVRSRLLARNVRQVAPLGGQIDHDVPGTIMGNWFVENTNGYAGNSSIGGIVAPDQQVGYWSTHLAIAPDPVDPSVIFMSLGSFGGRTLQRAIGNPAPHPRLVSTTSGPVKYELVGSQYIIASTGEPWHGLSGTSPSDLFVEVNPDHVEGTVLLELISEHRLRVEAFPGQRAIDVDGFTDEARIYGR